MHFLKCETRGCRAEEHLVLCAVCEALVCPQHAIQSAGEILCPKCAPASCQAFGSVCEKGQIGKPQMELFA